MNDQLRIIDYAIKATHGHICANSGCWGRVEEGTLCPDCDKRRQERDEDVLREGDDNADN